MVRRIFPLVGCALLAWACRAGPPPDPGLSGTSAGGENNERGSESDGPTHWADALDEALFSPEEAGRKEGRKEGGPVPGTSSAERDEGKMGTKVPPPRGRLALASANDAIVGGDLESALHYLEEAREALPPRERWIAGLARADVLLALWRLDDAIRGYEDLRTDPRVGSTPQVMGNLAVAYLRAARLEDARRACGEALRSRPDYPEGLKTLGLIDLAEGRRVEGQERLRRALELREDLPEAEVALAELSERSGDWRDALERYRRLGAKAEAYRAKDYHRRWKDLFHPATRSTEEELADRIGRLASGAAAEPLGRDVGLEPQGKETEP